MAERDGSRDFDPLVGDWDFHLRRLQRPLTGSTEWVEFVGTSKCRNVWDGRAQMDELSVVSRKDGTKLEGLTLRLYNPQTHEWSIYWANGKNPSFSIPTVGRFVDGRGEFYDHEEIERKKVLVRWIWFDLSTGSPKFEQSFSLDEGKTWEANWMTVQERRDETKKD